MSTDVEDLVRDGMHRLAAVIQAPTGLTVRARRRLRRRRLTAGAAITGAAAAITTVALAAAWPGGPATTAARARAAGRSGLVIEQSAGGASAIARARDTAYVIGRVENALAGENLVFRGSTTSPGQTSVTWAYGRRNRFEEFTGKACGHTLPSGECTYHGGSVPFLASGTALVGGKLTYAYVTYFDRRYSLSPVRGVVPANACSTTPALAMGGPPLATNHWSDFIHATLACGAAIVTGYVRIDGVETTKITGVPVTVRLSKGYARMVRERWARARWILYVDPTTYLPVRMYGSTQTFGGPGRGTLFTSITNVRWLPPTAPNISKALVTIPAGFRKVPFP